MISLSRAVDGIDGDRPENGILLVDMKYSFIEEMMNQVNDQNRGRYYYVCDGEGNLIYHPYANETAMDCLRKISVLYAAMKMVYIKICAAQVEISRLQL